MLPTTELRFGGELFYTKRINHTTDRNEVLYCNGSVPPELKPVYDTVKGDKGIELILAETEVKNEESHVKAEIFRNDGKNDRILIPGNYCIVRLADELLRAIVKNRTVSPGTVPPADSSDSPQNPAPVHSENGIYDYDGSLIRTPAQNRNFLAKFLDFFCS